MGWGYQWAPYVPVAERRRKAMQKVEKMKKKGQTISPVQIAGKTIAATFWGKAWCDNLESYSDYANRLPRGRTYVRNGSVIDLQLREGQVEALVSGSDLYSVKISIKPLIEDIWKSIQCECAGKIASLVDLLKGRLSGPIMEVVTRKKTGLFPSPQEMTFSCSCPDWAFMCKHVAAVLYGVGSRLDHTPELLFHLRGVNHQDLMNVPAALQTRTTADVREKMIAEDQLSSIFGIDLETGVPDQQPPEKKQAGSPKIISAKKPVMTMKTAKTEKATTAEKKTATKTKATVKKTMTEEKTLTAKKQAKNAPQAKEKIPEKTGARAKAQRPATAAKKKTTPSKPAPTEVKKTTSAKKVTTTAVKKTTKTVNKTTTAAKKIPEKTQAKDTVQEKENIHVKHKFTAAKKKVK